MLRSIGAGMIRVQTALNPGRAMTLCWSAKEAQQSGIDRNRIGQGEWSPGVDALGDDYVSHEPYGVENGEKGDGVGYDPVDKHCNSGHECAILLCAGIEGHPGLTRRLTRIWKCLNVGDESISEQWRLRHAHTFRNPEHIDRVDRSSRTAVRCPDFVRDLSEMETGSSMSGRNTTWKSCSCTTTGSWTGVRAWC